MKLVRVNLGPRSYDILIGEATLADCGEELSKREVGRRVFLVASPLVHELYGVRLGQILGESGFDVVHLLIPDGERAKNLDTVENMYTYLIAQKADRSSTLLALGGGVTGDVVGFVAATFLRGVPYIQVPTTLLAQVDSSVGGKTGVNHRLGKNLIGAFYQPDVVFIDTDTLASLPDREFQAGLYEVIKYGLIYDRGFFDFMGENLDRIREREAASLESMISRCCEIKAEVTSKDERESDLRRILNFGHTLGHALEAATEYERFKHGEAVAYGMVASVFLSHHRGLLSAETAQSVNGLIKRVGPLPSAADVSFENLEDALLRDKKRQDDRTVFILLDQIGRTVVETGFSNVTLAEVWARAVDELET